MQTMKRKKKNPSVRWKVKVRGAAVGALWFRNTQVVLLWEKTKLIHEVFRSQRRVHVTSGHLLLLRRPLPFFLGPFFWESSSPFFSSPESSDLAFRFSLLSSLLSLFSFESFLAVVLLGAWRRDRWTQAHDSGKYIFTRVDERSQKQLN